MEPWPVFICYRQSDGMEAAEPIYELLRDQPVRGTVEEAGEDGEHGKSVEARLDVYFDQAAPGVGDWTSVHEPYLKRCRAMIVVCTPGAKLVEGDGDWVHKEIDWWIENRPWAPILIDPLGAGDRYVPGAISDKWPNAQRIEIIAREWDALAEDRRKALEDRTRDRLIGGIASSARTFYRDELEQEQRRAAELQGALETQRRTSGILRIALVATIVLLVGALGAGIFAYSQQRLAEQRGSELATALRDAQVASVRFQLVSAQHMLATDRPVEAAIGALDLVDLIDRLRAEGADVEADRGAIDAVLYGALDQAAPAPTCRGGFVQIRDIAFSPDGEYLLAASGDGNAYLWRSATCELVRTMAHDDIVSQVAWAPDGASYLTASWDRSAVLHDTMTGETLQKLVLDEGRFLDVAIAPDGRTLATASSDGALEVWDIASGKATHLVANDAGRPKKVLFSPDGKLLLEMTGERTTPLWDYTARKMRLVIDGHERAVVTGRFFRDGTRLLTGSGDGSGRLFDTASGVEIARFGKRSRGVTVADIAPDGERVLLASEKTLEIWTIDPPEATVQMTGEDDIVKAEFLADHMIVVGDNDGYVSILDPDTRVRYLGVKGDAFTSQLYTVSAGRTHLAIVVSDGQVRIQRILTDPTAAQELLCGTVMPAYEARDGKPEIVERLKSRCAPAF